MGTIIAILFLIWLYKSIKRVEESGKIENPTILKIQSWIFIIPECIAVAFCLYYFSTIINNKALDYAKYSNHASNMMTLDIIAILIGVITAFYSIATGIKIFMTAYSAKYASYAKKMFKKVIFLNVISVIIFVVLTVFILL